MEVSCLIAGELALASKDEPVLTCTLKASEMVCPGKKQAFARNNLKIKAGIDLRSFNKLNLKDSFFFWTFLEDVYSE